MNSLLGTSAKTTIAGILVGLLPIADTVLKTIQSGQPVEWAKVLLGIGIMVIGRLAKDATATGVGN